MFHEKQGLKLGRFTQCIDCLITQKHGPSDFLRGIGRSLRLLLSRFRSKDVVLLPFVHLYSTLLPQVVGDRLKPHQMCVTGISPLRGSLRAAPMKMAGQEYHYCLTGSLRYSLSSCFVNGWVPLATLHWPSFMRETRTGGSWRILQSRFPLLAGRQGTYFSRRM